MRLRNGAAIIALVSVVTWACGRAAPPDAAPKSPDSTVTPTVTATTPVSDSAPRTEPWVTPSDTGPMLHLPPAMARTLAAKYPHFAPWPWASYPEVARNAHVHDTIASVRWVIGDLDGDGRRDVVLHGSLDTTVRQRGELEIAGMFAIMPRGDSAIVESVVTPERDPVRPPPATRPHWLVLVPRQTFRKDLVNDAVGTQTPRYDFLMPAQVYLWYENRFVQWADH